MRWDKGSGRITVAHSKTDAEAQGTKVAITPAAMAALSAAATAAGWAWPRTARKPTKSNARAAGSRPVAWSAATPAVSPPGRRCGTCNPFSFALITAVHHCPTVSVQGNTIDRDTDDDLSMVSTTRRFEETC